MVRIIVMTGALLALAGCNTVEGMGQDIQRGGQAIQRAAN
ncbi:entericidin A/B family lipoprotein [Aestuariibius sp. 2305UL40-4]